MKIAVTMAQDASPEERLMVPLELALRNPEQRQRLVDYFAILQDWSLERSSKENPVLGSSGGHPRDFE